ncbi:efflux transporter outer membrane subunit [Methylibium sp.]|uniref:efflux transporter outer membrane subunit n=1 Tax=Methylibium sp. TaxID=2067992 RepID=UPI003D134C7A
MLVMSNRLLRPLSLLAAALVVAGCASTQGIAPQAQVLAPSSLGVQDAAVAAPLAPDWWLGYGDAALDALVARALADSPDLKLAQARIAQAQAATGLAEAARLPRLDGSADATRQRYTENGLYPPPLAGSTRSSATLQLEASWELDLFGKQRAALDAAIGNARAAQADAQAARTLLAANVVRGYVELARLVEQKTVAERALAQRQDTLALVRQRTQAGIDTQVELRQAEGSVPDTRQQIESLNEQIALARHALAALTVQAPDALDALAPALSPWRLTTLPAVIPGDLLARRPDIAASRWRVEAAAKEIDVAKAGFYPSVNLVAFAGVSAIGLDRLFEAGSAQAGIGPAIRLPIFDAGRLRSNLRGRAAEVDAAVEAYNAGVLDAVREVADRIASLQSVERQAHEQREAQDAAESAYDLATQRYRAGLGSYLTVLTAETSVLSQRRQATDLKARALETQVALIRALGGGYQPGALPRGDVAALAAAAPSAR